jgi:hypothetical protein
MGDCPIVDTHRSIGLDLDSRGSVRTRWVPGLKAPNGVNCGSATREMPQSLNSRLCSMNRVGVVGFLSLNGR